MLNTAQMASGHTEVDVYLSTDVNNSVDNLPISCPDSTIPAASTVWEQAIDRLQPKITSQNFDMWFRPIACQSVGVDQVTLTVPNRFIREWFETHFLDIVLDEMFLHTKIRYGVIWLIDEKIPSASTSTQASLAKEGELLSPPNQNITYVPIPERPDLLSRYTFQSFIVGPSNQLAEAASRAVSQKPGGKYNPLFLYGGVGLGKTHLLHAIGHAILETHPTWRVVYIKTETFMNEYIHAVRNNKIDEFRTKYRKQPNVLLMDDIQYLGGKERTQDEFFHTFNALFESGSQIVVTADKYPHQIPDLEERIRSRFQWGLIADIQTPELETRMAILAKKAEYEGIELPSEVAYYLASNIRSNVRELEGLLIRVAAFASLQQKTISVDFAQESLKHFISQTSSHLTIDSIQRKIVSYFKISKEDLVSEKRHQSIVRPRQIAMYLSRKLCKLSYPDIAQCFGKKDHTTVLAACRKIESLMQTDLTLRQLILDIERQLA